MRLTPLILVVMFAASPLTAQRLTKSTPPERCVPFRNVDQPVFREGHQYKLGDLPDAAIFKTVVPAFGGCPIPAIVPPLRTLPRPDKR